MKESVKYLFSVAVLFMLLPFLMTVLLSGRSAVALSRNIDLEMLIPVQVYQEIPENAESEMIRAQAVLVRSRLFLELSKGEHVREILEKNSEYEKSHNLYPDILEECRQAAADTEGMVLMYGGQVTEGPFFAGSSGMTRDGLEVMGKEDYSWLVSVDSSRDMDSPQYISGVMYGRDDLYRILSECTGDTALKEETVFEQITVLSRDSAGYVLEIQVADTHLSGENFRKQLGLPSACFSMQELDGNIRFLCKGSGHGLGMSQYGANILAQEGKSFKEILEAYFPRCTVEQAIFNQAEIKL